MLSGLLVSGWDGWPSDVNINGVEGDCFFLAFPRPARLARLYVEWRISNGKRMTGQHRAEELIDVYRNLTCLPQGDRFARLTPAGPVASYPMTDGWTDDPTAEGVVLIGDAAGWSDPTLGQGLSVSMRDARIVSELLLANGRWSRHIFGDYVEERRERMRRLRITAAIMHEAVCDFSQRGQERRQIWRQQLVRDPRLLNPVSIMLTGPETAPAEFMTSEAVTLVSELGAARPPDDSRRSNSSPPHTTSTESADSRRLRSSPLAATVRSAGHRMTRPTSRSASDVDG